MKREQMSVKATVEMLSLVVEERHKRRVDEACCARNEQPG